MFTNTYTGTDSKPRDGKLLSRGRRCRGSSIIMIKSQNKLVTTIALLASFWFLLSSYRLKKRGSVITVQNFQSLYILYSCMIRVPVKIYIYFSKRRTLRKTIDSNITVTHCSEMSWPCQTFSTNFVKMTYTDTRTCPIDVHTLTYITVT